MRPREFLVRSRRAGWRNWSGTAEPVPEAPGEVGRVGDQVVSHPTNQELARPGDRVVADGLGREAESPDRLLQCVRLQTVAHVAVIVDRDDSDAVARRGQHHMLAE